MKIIIISAMSFCLFGGCVSGFGVQSVTFEYFNLSTNDIWVNNVIGLPSEAAPGHLKPCQAEDQLSVKASVFYETIPISSSIKIVWKDNGKQGWPGGLKPNELVPPGITHEVEFKRDDFGIPAKLTNVIVRFTYLGDDKWRIKFFKK
jgi:hypothetical protein